MKFSGIRFFTIFVDIPRISPDAHPITVISIPPHMIPPKNGGKESIMNQERTPSGLISIPLALTESPIQTPRKPIGGMRSADAKAPFFAVWASFAAARDCI